jgi:hypothetical protein
LKSRSRFSADAAHERAKLDDATKHHIAQTGFEPTLTTLSDANWRVFGMLLPAAAVTLRALSNEFVVDFAHVGYGRKKQQKKKNVIFIYLFIYIPF